MTFAIEQLPLEELRCFLREQAEDVFSDLKDEHRLLRLSEKWYSLSKICTCRDELGSLVGMVVYYANHPEDGIVYIPHVYVSGKHRRKNVMSSMLDIIKGIVREDGYRFFRLEVSKANERAQVAYLRYGFYFSGDASEKSFYMLYEIERYDRV